MADLDEFKKALEETPSTITPLEVRKAHERRVEELLKILSPIDILILYKQSYLSGTRIMTCDSQIRTLIGKEVRRLKENAS